MRTRPIWSALQLIWLRTLAVCCDDEDLGNSSDPLTEMPRLTTSTRSRASAVLWATWDSSCRPGDHVPSRAAPLYLASNRSHSSLPSRPCA